MDEKKVREAIEAFQGQVDWLKRIDDKRCEESRRCCIEYFETAIEALEKQLPKKPICVPKRYTEELGFNDEFLCPVCKSYVGYFTEGMSEPEQMEYCNDCGQHIAKDWSED